VGRVYGLRFRLVHHFYDNSSADLSNFKKKEKKGLKKGVEVIF